MSGDLDGDTGRLTPRERDLQGLITDAVAEISERRAAIEQAKGMLMMLHGVDAEQAFDLLKWQSQDHNVKLRELAEQVISDYRAVSNGSLATKDAYDRLFMSAHLRLVEDGGESPDTRTPADQSPAGETQSGANPPAER